MKMNNLNEQKVKVPIVFECCDNKYEGEEI